jgi:type III secretion protein T
MLSSITGLNVDFLYSNAQLLFLGAARPFGMALMFSVMTWAHLNSGLLRVIFSLVLALPVIGPLTQQPLAGLESLEAPFVVMMGKELALGAFIGFIMSLPFEGAVMAGSIADTYRGGSASLQSPTGEITPFGQLFIIVMLWLFASLGGFWWMADTVYSSYSGWPLAKLGPTLNAGGLNALTNLMATTIKVALVVAGPLIILMALTDVGFLIASKLAKQLNVTLVSIAVKSILAAFILPFYALVIINVYKDEMYRFAGIGKVLQAILGN